MQLSCFFNSHLCDHVMVVQLQVLFYVPQQHIEQRLLGP
jgi:hypothetical protein